MKKIKIMRTMLYYTNQKHIKVQLVHLLRIVNNQINMLVIHIMMKMT